jgi:hypothetical protein
MKALRDLGDRDEMVKEEWSESISGIIDDIGSRMSRLLLKDEPVTVAPSAIEDDVMVLKEVLQNACDDYSGKYRARDDLDTCQSWNKDSIRMTDSNQPTSMRYAELLHVVHFGSRSFSHIQCHVP